MTQILINDNIPDHATQRGVTRIAMKLIEGTVTNFGDQVTICSPVANDYGTAKFIYTPQIKFRGSHRLRLHDNFTTLAAYRAKPQIVCNTYYGCLRSKAPQSFIVYDMIHELLPQFFPPTRSDVGGFIEEKRKCLERADLLLVISESTARDIVQLYPQIDASKIVITWCGVENSFFARPAHQFNLKNSSNRPFFLFSGHRGLYKNFLRLLAAFGESGIAKDFDLRVLSPLKGDIFNPKEQACIEKYSLQSSIHLITAPSEEEIRNSHLTAYALVYPSEYEGFGLPILEGMASGTIVATANTSSMPEVGGNIAFYFNPNDVASIAESLTHVVNLSSAERQSRIEQGIARARLFTWERFQTQVTDGFQKMLAK